MVADKRWTVPDVDEDRRSRLAREVPCSRVVATLLLQRGIGEPTDARRFLRPRLTDLSDPETLPAMEAAVARIERAMHDGERILIFGDYDVDGISSTCLLLDFFRLVGHPVDFRLPNRLSEGYGLRKETVREFAKDGVGLVITVDNGSSSVEEVALASELGIDVVVTDHHQLPAELPRAAALVNPRAAREGEAGFQDYAGVGVTFKLVWALCQRLTRARKLSPEFREFLLDSLALVALGTISDVVPLRGENRIFSRFGLRYLQKTERPGLRRLVDAALSGNAGDRQLDSSHVGFGLGPRLNAAGRLGRAELAVQLLMTEDDGEAGELLEMLERANDRRRKIEAEMCRRARDLVASEIDLSRERAIVLGDESWHAGVLGIVAARLAEEFYRPTLLVALSGSRSRGSARSIPRVHITDALGRCRDLLASYGGHAFAAGVEIDAARLPDLRRCLSDAIDVPVNDMVPEVEADCRINLDEVTPALLDELATLAPFGAGNPAPVLEARDLEVVGQPRLLGRDGRHISFFVRQNGCALRAVAFGKGDLHREIGGAARISLLFQPTWNVWRERKEIEMLVKEIRTES
ncbi:MAG: single-stranded-DNA-specific exonuclease RecJ [Planctomycetota bacterium]|nr:single-stranded-DNA-specific exonuclease RecJ [Planctomycetota bacterium]